MSLSIEQLTRPLKISKRIQETSDAISLVLEIPAELKNEFHYQAGQFVTLFLDFNGETLNRSYSLCSSPLTDSEFKITIKKVQGGRGSTYLCDQAKEGQVLRVTRPAGHFFKPQLEPIQYCLFAAGSGITPILSIAKTVLTNSANRVRLLYCNRNEDSIIFASELNNLEKKYGDRLSIEHLLSQPAKNWTGTKGRCDTAAIERTLAKREAKITNEYYLCGPDGFMDGVQSSLAALKIDKTHIHRESFAIGLQPAPATLKSEWTYVGDKSKAKEKSGGKLIAMVQGTVTECEVNEDQSILEALIEAGANPPYSCMDGACMACMAKVQEGLVYQKDPGILSDENIENGETLTCQARVLSDTVRVSYDDI